MRGRLQDVSYLQQLQGGGGCEVLSLLLLGPTAPPGPAPPTGPPPGGFWDRAVLLHPQAQSAARQDGSLQGGTETSVSTVMPGALL